MFAIVRLDRAVLLCAERPLNGAAAPQLHGILDGAITEGASPIVVDLVSVPTIDEGIVAVLAAAADRIGHSGLCLELRLAGDRRFRLKSAFELRAALAQGFPEAA
ncbi:anti-sigma factor antagonist [Paractinoplanes rishiriensis]|uniref:STAS domain-containing protein n=1 Tax=Paractinoplanes rishiriensis TaxID=1050105 RepID=A0A919MWS4_9ACTN|nr:anti-sigma factor antagonist [Actinoplanes rishiriensis]GIE98138.1 hypothetical protein Ari01nite_56030 [Actinoplanes rishiriensis]